MTNDRLSRARAIGILGATLAFAPPVPGSSQTSPPIRIGTSLGDSYAEPFYAADAGFFSRAGLNVEPMQFRSSGAVAAAIAGNAIDIGLTDAIVLANAFNRGVPLTVIAGAAVYKTGTATSYLCIRTDAPYKTATDLEGQAVAVPTLVSISTLAVKMWLSKHGADLGKVHFLEMPLSEMTAAIEQGRVAGAYLAEPFLSQAPPNVRILGDVHAAIGDLWLITQWFTSHSWLASNRDLAKRLVAATYATALWANAHHDQTAPILAKYSKMDVARVRAMHRGVFATSLEPQLLQPVLDAGFAYKAIERPVSASALIADL